MPAPPTSKQQQNLKTPANTKAKSSGYQTGTSYSSKTAPKSTGGLLSGSRGTGGGSGGLLSEAQSKGKSGYVPGSGGQPSRPGTTGTQPTAVSGGRGVQPYDVQSRSYSNPATYTAGNPFSGGRSTAFPGTNLSSADYLTGGYGAYRQPPGYSNPATYSPGTPYGTLNGVGGRSEYGPGVNYSSGDYAQAGYRDYQQPPGAPPRQPPQFAAGNSPYPGGVTPPPMPGDFPQRDIRNVVAVRGGKGVQPYDTMARSYSNPPVYTPPAPIAKIQDRVPDTSIAMDASIPGRAMAASKSLFAGGVPGGYGMQPYDNPLTSISPTSAPQQVAQGSATETQYGGYPQQTGLYTGEGMVPPSTGPITTTARKIAEKISGPLARADNTLGQMFPGMSASTNFHVDPFRIGAMGDILSNGSNQKVGDESSNGEDNNPGGGGNGGNGGGGNGGGTPPPGADKIPWYYPQYYTNWWSGLPSGDFGGYYTSPNIKVVLPNAK